METETGVITWGEAVRQALNDTRYAYQGEAPPKHKFLGTFEEFYKEYVFENRVSSWPVDPSGSHRMAKNRAVEVWADDYSERVPAEWETDDAMKIDNHEEIIEAVESHEDSEFMEPNGDITKTRVENPRADGKAPEFLRVEAPRKGWNFKTIRLLAEYGLRVDDVWQLDKDKENGVVRFKVVPDESFGEDE